MHEFNCWHPTTNGVSWYERYDDVMANCRQSVGTLFICWVSKHFESSINSIDSVRKWNIRSLTHHNCHYWDSNLNFSKFPLRTWPVAILLHQRCIGKITDEMAELKYQLILIFSSLSRFAMKRSKCGNFYFRHVIFFLLRTSFVVLSKNIVYRRSSTSESRKAPFVVLE